MIPRIFMKGGLVMATRERSAGPVDQDVTAVQGGAAYLSDLERRLAPYFERAEPRQRALAYLRGLLSPCVMNCAAMSSSIWGTRRRCW